ncbi:putative fatty acid desaturase, putative,sphingolipid delta 4 desaturase, partial [Leishmania mexicana MHOM/GT/2001/U1103]
MLKAHGEEIKKLYGPDPWLPRLMTPFVLLQIYLGYRAKDMGWPTLLLVAYFVGEQ